MEKCVRIFILLHVFVWELINEVFAQQGGTYPGQVVNSYADQMTKIIKGPIAKIVSFVVLLACVGSLLRGRHRIAISCGIGFIILLFLQVI